MYDFTEFNKLVVALVERGHSVKVVDLFGGKQCQVDGNKWDFILHSGSYGNEEGLLEVYGMDYLASCDVEGYLTAEDVLARLDGDVPGKMNDDGDVFSSCGAMLGGTLPF